MHDQEGLGDFLRRRRHSLHPQDVGLPPGQRRRTAGLRREEVAALCHMSTDYYSRLERGHGSQPSEQMLTSIAQGLHLSPAEQDHLFRLAGHAPPSREGSSLQISPGLLRVFDRLTDTPAEIVTELGETLRQTPLSVTLTGDTTRFTGPARSFVYRWFTDDGTRALYPAEDHALHARAAVSRLRETVGRRGPDSRAARLSELLRGRSEEFADLWDRHEIGIRHTEEKRYLHPEVGLLALDCYTLIDPDQSLALLVYTATPGSDSYDKLRLLAVLGPPAMAQ